MDKTKSYYHYYQMLKLWYFRFWWSFHWV